MSCRYDRSWWKQKVYVAGKYIEAGGWCQCLNARKGNVESKWLKGVV